MEHKPRSEGFSPGNERKAFRPLIDKNIYSFAKIWVFYFKFGIWVYRGSRLFIGFNAFLVKLPLNYTVFLLEKI